MATQFCNGSEKPKRPLDGTLDVCFQPISISNGSRNLPAWKRTVSFRFCAVALLILIGLLNRPAPAQVSSASISGVVTDKTGAVVPGAIVTVKDLGTNRTRTTQTSASGLYIITNLAEGQYQVGVEKTGFATVAKTGINLTVGAARVQNIELAVGTIEQRVEVTAENIAQVESSTSQLGALVDERQMRELPLNGRNFEQLILMAPGVQPVTQGVSNSNYGRTAAYAVAGARPEGQSILLDGTDTQNFNGHGSGAALVGTLISLT